MREEKSRISKISIKNKAYKDVKRNVQVTGIESYNRYVVLEIEEIEDESMCSMYDVTACKPDKDVKIKKCKSKASVPIEPDCRSSNQQLHVHEHVSLKVISIGENDLNVNVPENVPKKIQSKNTKSVKNVNNDLSNSKSFNIAPRLLTDNTNVPSNNNGYNASDHLNIDVRKDKLKPDTCNHINDQTNQRISNYKICHLNVNGWNPNNREL